jgi:alkaline phosphatase/alkaline phosphatase D
MKTLLTLPSIFLFWLACAAAISAAEIHLAQGALAGEVTATTALLQTRLTATTGLVNGDVPGAAGVAFFEYDTTANLASVRKTSVARATDENDFIVRAALKDLKPATEYFYRVAFGPDEAHVQRGAIGRFKTLGRADAAAPVNFVLTSCLNYSFFHEGTAKGGARYEGADRMQGYPALEGVIALQPDFCIIDGDCVYYDHPEATRAKTLPQMRKKWHEQYVQSRFPRLFSSVPTYWLKDDHDYRRNDSDPAGDYEPSHDLGIATFREQAPVLAQGDRQTPTYRTIRFGRDLQLWFVEGRDYRSPNVMPDGPEKTIWGAEQKAWLQRTLKESDATFKLLISPSPMVGPDDAKKRDNHVNPLGFRQEGEAFFAWLKSSGIAPGRFYVLTGDRHWKYHSQHPSGYEEFSCGTFNTENARIGRVPGEAAGTDPKALVKQFYTDAHPGGGFLSVAVIPETGGKGARIEFSHHDDHGGVVYRHAQTAR